MIDSRVAGYLEHIRVAAADACSYTEEMDRDVFEADRRTQQAVIKNLVIIGEAATRIIDTTPAFVEKAS